MKGSLVIAFGSAALGFAGLLVQGGHHGPHHFAMAKGEMPPSHKP